MPIKIVAKKAGPKGYTAKPTKTNKKLLKTTPFVGSGSKASQYYKKGGNVITGR